MGTGLGRLVISNLDTNVAVWLAQGDLGRLTSAAKARLETSDLLISPIVLLELEYLYEVWWHSAAGFATCNRSWPPSWVFPCASAGAALDEKWTRDPFDRMIVANAKANGIALLVSSDEEIRKHYARAVW